MHETPHWIVLAHLLRPQGRKGELLAELLTDFPDRFRDAPNIWLAAPGYDDPAPPAQTAAITDFFLPVGRNAGRIVLRLAGVDTIEAAERLAGLDIVIPMHQRLALEEDAAYVSDLTGCTVYDGDFPLGVVEDVQFPTSPDGAHRIEDAPPLLAVRSPEGDEILIPFVKAFLVQLDLEARAIRMTLPEGLADVNR